MIRRVLLLFITLLLSATTLNAYNISGSVVDQTDEALPEAGVRILSAKDSTYVKGGAANMDGVFSITGLRAGKYIVEYTYVGYKRKLTNVEIKNASINVGKIVLEESSITLKEAVVTAVKTPITVKEDTIEFNADSYKTQPNAVIEDLLKRLPGVEVDSDGKITSNGKEVTKILVDGKEFFSDDPKVASKNLPVNMIDKLQVVDRKSDLARLTGVDDGEDETVINLTVKKGMKNGWFGTVEGGYGTDSRYQVAFNINRFWNDNQITFLGAANNTNDMGFTDGNGNRFRRFGGDRGVNTSQTFGVNFNVGNKEILRVGGNVRYAHSSRDTYTRREREYFFADSLPTESSLTQAYDKGHNFNTDFRIEWKPDSFNTFDFRPRFSYNINDSESFGESLNRAGNALRDSVTRSINNSDSHGKSYDFGGNLIYSHNFKHHKGRSFSIQANYQLSDTREDENTYSWNRFFLLDSTSVWDQYLDSHTWSNSVSARVTWTEPLGNVKKGNFLTFAYRMNYQWNNSDKKVYDHPIDYTDPMNPIINPDYLIFNDSLSNEFRNDYFTQNVSVGYKKVTKDITLDAGLAFVPSMSKSINVLDDRRTIPERWVWNYAPYTRFRYKMSRSRSMMVNYRGRSSQPSMTQLQPVPDYSDPLRVVIGNPNLDPTFTHNVEFRFQDFNQQAQRSIMLMLNVSATQNSIVSNTITDAATSGQVTTYENVNGVWSARLMNMISLPFKRRTWTFNNMMFLNFNQQIGFTNAMRNRSRSVMWNESFGIAFRPDNLELELRPFYRLQTSDNTVATNNQMVHNYGGRFNGTYYTPWGIVLSTDLNYTQTSGYSSGFNTKSWMWNATIAYQFLRDKSATFSVKAYDLLHQQNNTSRTYNYRYTEDTEYNTLSRYFMFTLTYKFNTFGKGNQPESRNMGPGGPGRGPGRGPGGPGGPGRRF
ncbi:MAG: outer membrane beta-barrel protein [Bacteroidales bacterium]|nr:outer membrane beta-barrel protein [Bacteroidales bacterium]